MRVVVAIIATVLLAASCSSPLDLGVPNEISYSDAAIHPKKVNFLYYFGEYRYEAIITDTAFLNSVWLVPEGELFAVTIPKLVFGLPSDWVASFPHTPFVTTLSFSIDDQLTNGFVLRYINEDTWFKGTYLDEFGNPVAYEWQADDYSHQFRMSLYKTVDPFGGSDPREVKGNIELLLEDPTYPAGARWVKYFALMTISY